MTNLQKYDNAFMERFAVTEQDLNAGLAYQSIPAWDSVGHMALMAALEGTFDIMFEMDDILDFSSYQKGKEILKKYNIEL
jgi:acyl carrier protein